MLFRLLFTFNLIGMLVFAGLAKAQATEPQSPSSNCWQEVRLDIFEWTCAERWLDEGGKAFAHKPVLIRTNKSLLLTESGATAQVGQHLAEDLVRQFGNKPLWLINSQPKPEHVLGNVGFASIVSKGDTDKFFTERIVSGALTAKLMGERCPSCIENFAQLMGAEHLKGTTPLIPKKILSTKSSNLGGLGPEWSSWRYKLVKQAMTEEALVLRSKDFKFIWVGGLIQASDIPDLYHGNIAQRIEFLSDFYSTTAENWLMMGSQGRFDLNKVKRDLDYFVDLQVAVLRAQIEGATEVETINALSGSERMPSTARSAKDLETHQLNIQRVWRQMEELTF